MDRHARQASRTSRRDYKYSKRASSPQIPPHYHQWSHHPSSHTGPRSSQGSGFRTYYPPPAPHQVGMFPQGRSGLVVQQIRGLSQQQYLQQSQTHIARPFLPTHSVSMDGQYARSPISVPGPQGNLIDFDDSSVRRQSNGVNNEENETMSVRQPKPRRPHLQFRPDDMEESAAAQSQSPQMFAGIQAGGSLPNNIQATMFAQQQAQALAGIRAQAGFPTNMQAPMPSQQQSAHLFPANPDQPRVPSSASFVMHSAQAKQYFPFANSQSTAQRNPASQVDNADGRYRGAFQGGPGPRPDHRQQNYNAHGPTIGFPQEFPRLKVVSAHELIQRNKKVVTGEQLQNGFTDIDTTRRFSGDKSVHATNRSDRLSNARDEETVPGTVDQTGERLEYNQQRIADFPRKVSNIQQHKVSAKPAIIHQQNNMQQIVYKTQAGKRAQFVSSGRRAAPAPPPRSNQAPVQRALRRARNSQADRGPNISRRGLPKITNRSAAYRQHAVDNKNLVGNTTVGIAPGEPQANNQLQVNIQSNVTADQVQSRQAQAPSSTITKFEAEEEYRPSFLEVFGKQDTTPPGNNVSATVPSILNIGDRPPTLGELMQLRDITIKQEEASVPVIEIALKDDVSEGAASSEVLLDKAIDLQPPIEISDHETKSEPEQELRRNSEGSLQKSSLHSTQSMTPVASINDADKVSDHAKSIDSGEELSISRSEHIDHSNDELQESQTSITNKQTETASTITTSWKAGLASPTTLTLNVLSAGQIPRSSKVCETCSTGFSSALEVISHKLKDECGPVFSSRASLVESSHTAKEIPRSNLILAQLLQARQQRVEEKAAMKIKSTPNSEVGSPALISTNSGPLNSGQPVLVAKESSTTTLPTPITPGPTTTIPPPHAPVVAATSRPPARTPNVSRPPRNLRPPRGPPTAAPPATANRQTRRSHRTSKTLLPNAAVPARPTTTTTTTPQARSQAVPQTTPQVQNRPGLSTATAAVAAVAAAMQTGSAVVSASSSNSTRGRGRGRERGRGRGRARGGR